MSAVWFRARAELRARWRASIGLALVIGLAGGLVIAAAAGARRQDSTFPKFRRFTNVAQAGVANSGAFFGFANVDFKKAAALPQVVDSAPFNFFIGFAKTSGGKLLTPVGDQNPVVFFSSADGSFDRHLNRMFVVGGRLADPNVVDEVMVSYIASQQYGIRVGDTIDLQMPTRQDLQRVGGRDFTLTGPRVRLRVVGIEAESFELPPGLGYPPIHLTPAFWHRYIGVTPTFPALLLKLRSDGDIPAVVDGMQRTAILPGSSSRRVQFFDETSIAAAIQRTAHVQATALWLLSLLAGVAAVLIFAQAIVRQSFLESDDHPSLNALGMSSGQMYGATMIRLMLIAAAGTVLALIVAIAVSPLTPIGLLRLIDTQPGISFDASALMIGAAAILAAISLIGSYAAVRTRLAQTAIHRTAAPAEHPSRIADALARSAFPPSSVAGVRMALEPGRGRTSVPVRSTVFGAAVGLAALVTAFTFGASLTHFLHTPRLVGWNWSGTIGDDFDGEDAARVLPILEGDPDVAEISGGGDANARINGLSVPIFGQDQVKGAIDPTVLEGRAPRAIDEIVVGGVTLRQIHARVGDSVNVFIEGEPKPMRIVGRAVIPPIVGTPQPGGVGAWMTFQAARRLQPSLAEDTYLIRFVVGANVEQARARLKQDLPDIAVSTTLDIGNATDFQRIINLPIILAALLALLAAATLMHTLLTVVRRRGRDLAVLKTLGFVRSQVRAAVAWQVTTLLVVALILAIPVGFAAGRWAWDTFAGTIGFVPEPIVKWVPIIVLIPAAVLLGNLIATLPARAAARTRPAEVFRTE